MSKSIPSFPLPCDFKTCPAPLTKDISNYFYDLSNYLRYFNIQICNVCRDISTLSDNFARGDISPFLSGRFLTKSENSLSDSIENLSSLYDSLREIANSLRGLLPPSDPDRAEPSPNTPTDSSTKH